MYREVRGTYAHAFVAELDTVQGAPLRPTLVVRGWLRPSWWASASVESASPDGVVHVAVTCEPLDAGDDLATYAARIGQELAAAVSITGISDARDGPSLQGRPTQVRVADWAADDGEELSTLVVVSADAGIGVRATATAPAAVFAQRNEEITELLERVELPWPGATAAAPSTIDLGDRLRRAVTDSTLPRAPGEWGAVRAAWQAGRAADPASAVAEELVLSSAEAIALAFAGGASSFPGIEVPFARHDAALAGATAAAEWSLVARQLLVDEPTPRLGAPLDVLVDAALRASVLVALREQSDGSTRTTVLAGHPGGCLSVQAIDQHLFALRHVPTERLVDAILARATAAGADVTDVSVVHRVAGRAVSSSCRLAQVAADVVAVDESGAPLATGARDTLLGCLPD